MPDYADDPDYLPPKTFMWDVFASLNHDLASRIVDHAMKKRNNDEEDPNKTIDVDETIFHELMSSNYFSKHKGRAITMMTAAGVEKKIKRKRKREVKMYDPIEDSGIDKRSKLSADHEAVRQPKHRNPFTKEPKSESKKFMSEADVLEAYQKDLEESDEEKGLIASQFKEGAK